MPVLVSILLIACNGDEHPGSRSSVVPADAGAVDAPEGTPDAAPAPGAQPDAPVAGQADAPPTVAEQPDAPPPVAEQHDAPPPVVEHPDAPPPVVEHPDAPPPAGPSLVTEASPVTTDIVGISGSGPSEVFAVGPNRTVLHSTGHDDWTVTSAPPSGLYSVWVAAPDAVYVGGSAVPGGAPILLSSDGAGMWTTITNLEAIIPTIWGSGSTDIWASTTGAFYSALVHSVDHGIFDYVPIGLVNNRPGGGDTTNDFVISVTGSHDGRTVAVLVNRSVQESLSSWVVISMDGGANWSPMRTVPMSGWQSAAWFSGTELWVVGDAGAAHTSDGTVWLTATGSPPGLRAVWGSSPSDVWVAGTGGAIAHSTDGLSFNAVASPTSSDLLAIWGSGPSDIYFAGNGGTILRWH